MVHNSGVWTKYFKYLSNFKTQEKFNPAHRCGVSPIPHLLEEDLHFPGGEQRSGTLISRKVTSILYM